MNEAGIRKPGTEKAKALDSCRRRNDYYGQE